MRERGGIQRVRPEIGGSKAPPTEPKDLHGLLVI